MTQQPLFWGSTPPKKSEGFCLQSCAHPEVHGSTVHSGQLNHLKELEGGDPRVVRQVQKQTWGAERWGLPDGGCWLPPSPRPARGPRNSNATTGRQGVASAFTEGSCGTFRKPRACSVLPPIPACMHRPPHTHLSARGTCPSGRRSGWACTGTRLRGAGSAARRLRPGGRCSGSWGERPGGARHTGDTRERGRHGRGDGDQTGSISGHGRPLSAQGGGREPLFLLYPKSRGVHAQGPPSWCTQADHVSTLHTASCSHIEARGQPPCSPGECPRWTRTLHTCPVTGCTMCCRVAHALAFAQIRGGK